MDTASFDTSISADSDSSQDIPVVIKKGAVPKKKAQVGGQNSKVKGALPLGPHSTSEDEQQNQESNLDGDVQVLILQELRRVNARLDTVEEQIAEKGSTSSTAQGKGQKLSKASVHNSCSVARKSKQTSFSSSSESSEDDSDIPSLQTIRSSKSIQAKIDKKLTSLEKSKRDQGNDLAKIKSKRGGATEVLVNNKVAWPQDHILGGPTKQRLSYDQLNLTQFVQGFARNILEESDENSRKCMLNYLSDLMEDANDFSWSNAKASHAVLMCEMERGAVNWCDTTRIDRIRRAHAQKHNPPHRQNWVKNPDSQKKPWYCKPFQLGFCKFGKDHEQNGKMHKHICAHCLTQGRFLGHPEKDCQFLAKQSSKNEQIAAQH